MEKIKEEVVKILKKEMEFSESDNYSQWVLGVSVKKDARVEDEGRTIIVLSIRVAVKTNLSPYVDAAEITGVALDEKVTLASDYFEQTPEVQGSEVIPAINWLGELKGSVDYINLVDPNERKADKTKKVKKDE